MHSRTRIIRQSMRTMIVLFAVLCVSCAQESFGLKMEPQSVAAKFGFANCLISPPMSQEAVLAHARVVGNSDLASLPKWNEMVRKAKIGGNLRLVDCSNVTQGPSAGAFFYGLFRDRQIVAKVYPMIFN